MDGVQSAQVGQETHRSRQGAFELVILEVPVRSER